MRPLIVLVIAALSCSAAGAELRALPAGELPNDARLGKLKDLDGYFPFGPSASPEVRGTRARALRMQIRVALGIWPEPSRTPLNPVVYGAVDRPEYTVEKVFFESMPGFYVTGNLYRPKNFQGRRPGVLCPHGHWPDGRFMDVEGKEFKETLSSGAEQFEAAAHSPLQARCVQLARMGCVVFHYDMLGYADSVQISMELAHKFAKQRPEMNAVAGWGLFSPQAESHAQSVLGLQIWNGVRAIDFLSALPDVDPARIGVTGASGGGTQTMLLSAIDPRITASFPAVMVSTAMQGGCTCENASLLRIGTGNVEFAALFAPRPMGMTAANDWTKEMPAKGFPELQRHWAMLGAPEAVQLTALTQFPHNYNGVSRAAMYAWFNRYLNLGLSGEAVDEHDFQRLSKEELSVWSAEHPAPEGGAGFERGLLHWWSEDAEKQIAASPEGFAAIASPAWQTIVSHGRADKRSWLLAPQKDLSNYHLQTGLIRNETLGHEIPLLILSPENWNGRLALWLDTDGKKALIQEDASAPIPAVEALLKAGWRVAGADLFAQGEFLQNGRPMAPRRVENPRECAAYTYGYNKSVCAERANDLLDAAEALSRVFSLNASNLSLVALGDAGPAAAAARAAEPDHFGASVIQTGGFRFGAVADLWSESFLPAAAKYGDIPGALALAAPHRVLIIGETEPLQQTVEAYRSLRAEDALQVEPGGGPSLAAAWILKAYKQETEHNDQ